MSVQSKLFCLFLTWRDTYPDAKCWPFGAKWRSKTQEPWPDNVLTSSPLLRLWTLIWVSSEPLSSSLESGENATDLTGRAWFSSCVIVFSVSRSKTLTQPATLPAASSFPSGLLRKVFVSKRYARQCEIHFSAWKWYLQSLQCRQTCRRPTGSSSSHLGRSRTGWFCRRYRR